MNKKVAGTTVGKQADRGPWTVRLREHRRHLEVGHLERSRLAQHSFEENHRLLREEAKILETEMNPVCRKYKKETYVA